MFVLGMFSALVNFNPIITLPYLISNSACNYAVRGIKHVIKGVCLAALAGILVGLVRQESLTMSFILDPMEVWPPFLYLMTASHYIGYVSYVRGKALMHRRD